MVEDARQVLTDIEIAVQPLDLFRNVEAQLIKLQQLVLVELILVILAECDLGYLSEEKVLGLWFADYGGDLDEESLELFVVELEGEEGLGVVGVDVVVDHALVLAHLLRNVSGYLLVVVDVLYVVDQHLVYLLALELLLAAHQVLQQDLDEVLLELHQELVAVDQLLELLLLIEIVEDDQRLQDEVVRLNDEDVV